MSISKQWTPKERLSVIAEILIKIDAILRAPFSPTFQKELFDLTTSAYYVAIQPATFLEENKSQIMEDAKR